MTISLLVLGLNHRYKISTSSLALASWLNLFRFDETFVHHSSKSPDEGTQGGYRVDAYKSSACCALADLTFWFRSVSLTYEDTISPRERAHLRNWNTEEFRDPLTMTINPILVRPRR